jgi:antitoxin component YwqK of YwqJK toxin-antitoxin module
MKFRIINILFLIIIFSCSSKKRISENHTSGNKLNEISKEYNRNGNLKAKWNYQEHKLNGISKSYLLDGTFSEWKYQNGELLIGNSFYKSGKIFEKYNFKKGKRDGKAFRFYETGEKEITWNYKNDSLLNGIGYYQTGEKKFDYNYKNGVAQGISLEYYRTGEKKMEWNYSNGELNGISIQYLKNGKKKAKWNYKNGELSGESIEYYENGNVKRVLNF